MNEPSKADQLEQIHDQMQFLASIVPIGLEHSNCIPPAVSNGLYYTLQDLADKLERLR